MAGYSSEVTIYKGKPAMKPDDSHLTDMTSLNLWEGLLEAETLVLEFRLQVTLLLVFEVCLEQEENLAGTR